MNDDLELALYLADRADAVTTDQFGRDGLVVRQKPDRTPVTNADLAAEELLTAILAERRPDDGVLGEERGGRSAPDGRVWVLDPIDGTKNFLRGVPVWATLISLAVDGEPVLGVVSAPALGRRWWGVPGVGARVDFLGRVRELRVSEVAELDDSYLSTTELSTWGRFDSGPGYLDLVARVYHDRAFGDFWSHCLVAEGGLDIAAEPVVSPWDIMAPAAVVRAAGGRCTALDGGTLWNGDGVLSANPKLHEIATSFFGSRQR
jgi:histidinol-phosphatase